MSIHAYFSVIGDHKEIFSFTRNHSDQLHRGQHDFDKIRLDTCESRTDVLSTWVEIVLREITDTCRKLCILEEIISRNVEEHLRSVANTSREKVR